MGGLLNGARVGRRGRWLAAAAGVALALAPQARALQGDESPVYVDDSPSAWELFRRARDQEHDNPGEAARLYQELLDTAANKIVPRSDLETDHFISVRRRAHAAMLSRPEVLSRYRTIETTEARRLLDAGLLNRLIETRFLTEPALEAVIRSAQEEVEAGRFAAALQLLGDAASHPDLTGRRAAYRWMLVGLAAHHLGLDSEREAAIAALEAAAPDADAALCLAELRRLTALESGAALIESRGLTVHDLAPAARLDVLVSKPIWSVPLDETVFRRRFRATDPSDRTLLAGADIARMTGEWLTSPPTLAGGRVFINEGHVIRAFDRFSQREFWTTRVGEQSGIVLPRGVNSLGDMNVVAVSGDRVVTLTGHAASSGRAGAGRVACLDADDGSLVWTVDLERALGRDEYEGIFPHGAPVIADGCVYVLARKVRQQALPSTYVVALDLNATDDEARVRWVRYVASSGTAQPTESRPFSTLALDRGSVFVVTSIGAVACLDGATGEIRWLHRMSTSAYITPGGSPWEIGQPVVIGDTMFTITPDHRAIVALDRATGIESKRIDAAAWGSPRYLVNGSTRLFAVGADVSSIDPLTPDVPMWTLNRGDLDTPEFDPRGRVQCAGNFVLIPTQKGIVVAEAESGLIAQTIPASGAALPLASGEELFVATSDRLDAYMPLMTAEDRLREQILSSRGDTQPALSLLRLAEQSDDPARSIGLALEASDFVSGALDDMTDRDAATRAQRELFDTLVAVARRHGSIDYERGDALHGRIGAVAANNAQRVEHLLARGDWLAKLAADTDRARLAEAIESFQSIVADDLLAATLVATRHVERPAGTVAMERLAAAIEQFGPSTYEPLSIEAARRLAEMTARGEHGPDAARAIARRFSLAPAASEAALIAGIRYGERGDPLAAVATLREHLDAGAAPSSRPRLHGELAHQAQAAGWSEATAAFLVAAEREGLQHVETAQGARSPAEWLATLDHRARAWPLPTLGRIVADPDVEQRALSGRLIAPHPTLRSEPPDRALLLAGQDLLMVTAPGLDTVWATPLADPAPELLAFDERQILLWLTQSREVLALDANTGADLWRSGELDQSTRLLRQHARPRAANHIEIADGRARRDALEAIPLAGGGDVIVVGRTGGIQRFGGSVAWQTDHPLDAVHFAARHDFGVVLAGVVRSLGDRGVDHGRLVIIDPSDGAARVTIDTPDLNVPRWLAITPRGDLVYGTRSVIEAIDLASGERAWTSRDPAAAWIADGWAFDGSVCLVDATGSRQAALRVRDGAMSDGFRPRPDGPSQSFELVSAHPQGSRVVMRFRDRVAWFGLDGAHLAQDAVTRGRNYTHLAIGADRVAAISYVNRPPGAAATRDVALRTSYINEIWVFDESGRIVDGGSRAIDAERTPLDGVRLLDGWLLLSSRVQTIALPTSSNQR